MKTSDENVLKYLTHHINHCRDFAVQRHEISHIRITLDDVKDEKIRETFVFLFHVLEELSSENHALKQEN